MREKISQALSIVKAVLIEIKNGGSCFSESESKFKIQTIIYNLGFVICWI